ncbi:hypothetical protein TIFTF001_009295 [Ficus carica]|uniref:Uncharacterized protein n=1 Tax=Ficus carica TaxID=3494 RepID=A0AA88D2G7_FICCA|nr:hypothetical protein TIFTF001_009295 [Ficus carica]
MMCFGLYKRTFNEISPVTAANFHGFAPAPLTFRPPSPTIGSIRPSSDIAAPPPEGNNHTTVIAVCVSLGAFLLVGIFCLSKKKKKKPAGHESGGIYLQKRLFGPLSEQLSSN